MANPDVRTAVSKAINGKEGGNKYDNFQIIYFLALCREDFCNCFLDRISLTGGPGTAYQRKPSPLHFQSHCQRTRVMYATGIL
jgi:hypothetical protein